jgi:hypothetical protein
MAALPRRRAIAANFMIIFVVNPMTGFPIKAELPKFSYTEDPSRGGLLELLDDFSIPRERWRAG